MADKASGETKQKQPTEILIHYVKCDGFRTVHADGAIGGATPNGKNLHVSFYAERLPIPRAARYELGPGGKLGGVLEQEGRGGVYRELQFDAIMNYDTARALRKWLDDQISQHEGGAKKKGARK